MNIMCEETRREANEKVDNKELEEAIKILEDKECFWNNSEIKVLEAIETVLKELKRLQEENRQQRWQLNSAFEKGFIHKDKIREKEEELEKEYKEALEENSTKAFIVKCQIEILKELLEGG